MQSYKKRDQRVTTVTMMRVKDSLVLAGSQISNRPLSPLRLPLTYSTSGTPYYTQSMGYISLLSIEISRRKKLIEYEVHNHSAPNAIPVHG